MKKSASTGKSKPLQFLEKAQKDKKLNARVHAAIERGGRVTAEEVIQIANEFGFKFTQSEFEKAVKRDMAERFAAGDEELTAAAKKPKPKPVPKPPLSTCARGCLSWTKSFCPDRLQ